MIFYYSNPNGPRHPLDNTLNSFSSLVSFLDRNWLVPNLMIRFLPSVHSTPPCSHVWDSLLQPPEATGYHLSLAPSEVSLSNCIIAEQRGCFGIRQTWIEIQLLFTTQVTWANDWTFVDLFFFKVTKWR